MSGILIVGPASKHFSEVFLNEHKHNWLCHQIIMGTAFWCQTLHSEAQIELQEQEETYIFDWWGSLT